MTAPKYYTTNQ